MTDSFFLLLTFEFVLLVSLIQKCMNDDGHSNIPQWDLQHKVVFIFGTEGFSLVNNVSLSYF